MQPPKGKGLLIVAWVITAITLIIMVPIAFIAGIFSSDDVSGATVIWSYFIIAAPLLFLVLPICAQVGYGRTRYQGARWFSIASIVFCVAALAYLGAIFLGLPVT